MITLQPMNIVQCAADLIFSPLWKQFPDVTVALSEGGIGWIPYFLERVDRVYKQHKAWTHQTFGDKLPSDVFLERIVTCFIDDAFGVESRDKLNLDMITWECDYPHSDSTWPLAPETLGIYLDGVPGDQVAKITHENAVRLFSSTPSRMCRRTRRPSARCGPKPPTSTSATARLPVSRRKGQNR